MPSCRTKFVEAPFDPLSALPEAASPPEAPTPEGVLMTPVTSIHGKKSALGTAKIR